MSIAGFAPLARASAEPLKLAMQGLWLTGRVLPIGARLWVRHEFESSEARPVEVIYGFMLPRDATLRRFRISGEGFSVASELLPTEEARKTYEQGIAAGSLSSMARQYGDGLVNLSVGNVRPGEKVVVLLELVAGVELRDDGLRLRFPFTLAPSYHAKARAIEAEPGVGEMELPESEFDDLILPRFSQDATNLHRVGFSLEVHAGEGVREVASPSHSVRVQTSNGQPARVSLARESDLPNRDLVLDVRREPRGTTVLSGLDHEGKGRYAVVIPSNEFGEKPDGARNLIILLDRSGSMEGQPLQQAKKAIAACLAALDPNDRFGLVCFDTQTDTFRSALAEVTKENQNAAGKFLEAIQARGGTELALGLRAAGDLLAQGDSSVQGSGDIMIFTDGQVSATEHILARARSAGHRVHCLGIGGASQDRFLAHLAEHTGGVSRFLTPHERVDLAAVELFAAIGRPVGHDISVSATDQAGTSSLAGIPSNVYAGAPLRILGDTAGGNNAEVKISWLNAEGKHDRAILVSLTANPLADTLRLLQGSRLISELESRMTRGEEASPIAKKEASRGRARLAELSREYGLASSEMALVAVVKREGDGAGEIPRTVVVAVGMPESTSFAAYFCSPDQAAARPMAAPMAMSTASAGGVIRRLFARAGSSLKKDEGSDGFAHMANLEPVSAASDDGSPENVLITLAGMLEPDGGMPGGDEEMRIANSLAALLFFVAQGHSASGGIFRIHVGKLLSFLTADRLQRLPSERRDAAQAALRRISAGQSLGGDWASHAERLADSGAVKAKVFWRDLEAAVDARQAH